MPRHSNEYKVMTSAGLSNVRADAVDVQDGILVFYKGGETIVMFAKGDWSSMCRSSHHTAWEGADDGFEDMARAKRQVEYDPLVHGSVVNPNDDYNAKVAAAEARGRETAQDVMRPGDDALRPPRGGRKGVVVDPDDDAGEWEA